MASAHSPPAEPARKRMRTSHACDTCRAKKIRCDGHHPCATCAQAETECTYGSEANSRGKTDCVLEGVLRVEKLLHNLHAAMASPSGLGRTPFCPPLTSPAIGCSVGRSSFSGSPVAEPYHRDERSTPLGRAHHPDYVENAILDPLHISTTESILQWPHFDVFPSLRNNYVPIFDLEQGRVPVKTRAITVHPYVSLLNIDSILDAFQHTVNFLYPTMSQKQLQRIQTMTSNGLPEDDNADVCLALLTLALGCASQVVANLTTQAMVDDDEKKRRMSSRGLGDMYFDGVLKRMHVAHEDVSPTATHCLLFAAMYFAFLRRPLQAWKYINSAATKCLLLLSYPTRSQGPEDEEQIRRIFWSCYILESDYLAELSGVPESGLARTESSIPLPGAVAGSHGYTTHASAREEEQSLLYFLACISMRRLLNRVHQSLYAQGTGVCLNVSRFPYVVAELNHQLEEWRDVLPATFAFSVSFDCEPAATEEGGFLRQRYLTCRSLIYRPYLMWILRGSGVPGFGGSTPGRGGPIRQEVLANCQACLDTCLLHILNLRGFAQTVLLDTWICSLSMAGAMLVLLAACRVPSLRDHMPREVLSAGNHLRHLLESWQQVSGEPNSPSVNQAVQIIGEADRLIREEYGVGHESAMPNG